VPVYRGSLLYLSTKGAFVSYLERSFNFSSDAITSVLQTLSLKFVLNFRGLSDACPALGLVADTDVDTMFNEFSSAKVALERIVQSQASAGRKFHKNMFKLVAHTYCLYMAIMQSPKESEKNRNCFLMLQQASFH